MWCKCLCFCFLWVLMILLCVKVLAILVSSMEIYTGALFVSVDDVYFRDTPDPTCLRALLTQTRLSIFVTGSKFDVSYFQLAASEPCMNELVIYTKCLIKSAASRGINIVKHLGIFTGSGWMSAYSDMGLWMLQHRHLKCYLIPVEIWFWWRKSDELNFNLLV